MAIPVKMWYYEDQYFKGPFFRSYSSVASAMEWNYYEYKTMRMKMPELFIDENYKSMLSLRETETAIKFIKHKSPI